MNAASAATAPTSTAEERTDKAPLDFPVLLGAADADVDVTAADAADEIAFKAGLIADAMTDATGPFFSTAAEVVAAKTVGAAAKSFGMTKGASPAFPKSTLPVESMTSGLAAKKLRVNIMLSPIDS